MPQTGLWLWDSAAALWVQGQADTSGNLRTEENHIGIAPILRTGTGLVNAGKTRLHWIVINPSSANFLVELNDAMDTSTAAVISFFGSARESHPHNFIPPAMFSVGLTIKTLTNITAVIIGFD